MSRYFGGTLEKILGLVSRKFSGIGSEELFAGNSQEFPQILSTFSPVFLSRIGYKKFNFLGMGYKKFLGIGTEKFLMEKLSTFSPDFPMKDSPEFTRIPRKV